MSQATRDRRAGLAAIAKETLDVLPGILQQLPQLDAERAEKLDYGTLAPLDPTQCPKFSIVSPSTTTDGDSAGKTNNVHGTKISVVNEDTYNAAMALASSSPAQDRQTTLTLSARNTRVVVLNLASDKTPGGGWLNGSTAQEEALCYRSSLALSLDKSHYPWTPLMGFYTRDVVIIRSAMGAGHRLLTPNIAANDLPVVSVISVAGIRNPPLKPAENDTTGKKKGFKNDADRDLTKKKMRFTLRIAARERHELLVFGAIGCGAFHNPPEEVADCWKEVLDEDEFKGGWWREISFAVFDRNNEGNFEVFEKTLGNQVIGRVQEETAVQEDA
jgi:hypothetical protein